MFISHALIIEDNRDSVDVLARLLKNEGVSHVAVMRPTELQPSHLDGVRVVFLDLDLPGLNGYEVFQWLRDEAQLDAPIIAYTVNTNEKATVRNMGFDGMLAKPLDPSEFHDHLARILAGEAVWEG